MKSKFAVVIALISIVLSAGHVKAQSNDKSPWHMDIGLEAGAAVGEIARSTRVVLGATFRLNYNLTDRTSIIFTPGFYGFLGRKHTVGDIGGVPGRDLGVIPVKLGVKTFLSENIFVAAEGGAGFETYKEWYQGHQVKLILSPSIGWAAEKWNISFKYENFSGKGEVAHFSSAYGVFGLRFARQIF